MSILPQSENLRQSSNAAAAAVASCTPGEAGGHPHGADLGLSLSHISPQGSELSGASVVETPPQIKYAIGGSLCQVSRGGVRQGGGKRGAISGRSAQSRKRLLDLLHSVNREAFDGALFVTLTYPDEVDPEPKKVHRDLDCFAERLRRLYPNVAGVWSQEPKMRKSGAHVGKVYYHYHLIIFGVGFLDAAWLSRIWFEIVGSGLEKHLKAGTNIQLLMSAKQGIAYVAKYISKSEIEAMQLDKTGRTWGVFGREDLPVSFAYAVLTLEAFFSMRRQLRHFVRASQKRRKRKVRYRSDEISGVTAYISDQTAVRLLMVV